MTKGHFRNLHFDKKQFFIKNILNKVNQLLFHNNESPSPRAIYILKDPEIF